MTDDPQSPTPIGDALLASQDAEAGQKAPTPAEEAPTAPAVAQGSPLVIPEAAPIPEGAPAAAPIPASSSAAAQPILLPQAVAELVAASATAKAQADQREVSPGNVGVPTQVANPRRTAWRTVVQSIVATLVVAVPLANAVLANLSDYLHTQHDLAIAPWVFVAVNGALAVTALASGLVARLMATPGAAAFVARYLPFLAPIKTSGAHELV